MRKVFVLSLVFTALICGGCSEELYLCPDENHPHAIDLGLPNGTKWACCNVGAPSPEHSGGYYSWGETNIKSVYDEDHYESPDYIDDIAGTEYDAAYMNWGNNWRMPNYEQVSELLNCCKDKKGTTYKGVKGLVLTGPSGNSIFLPFAGFTYRGPVSGDFQGYLWTSTRDGNHGEAFKFNKKNAFHEAQPREFGFNIRPITK